ncbi:MAG: phosphotransferase [Mucilaginibacter sp.]
MIPENKKEAVLNALQTTFGTSKIDNMRQLTAGLSSAVVLRIVVRGKPYLLRIIARTDAISAPSLEYACMQAAAEAAIAPKVWYANAEERIAVTDFIDARPFPIDEARKVMPELLKRLHSLPPFPFRINYLDSMEALIQKFQAAKIMPLNITDELFRIYNRIKNVYPRHGSDMVACHNDLKPENMLFDGERLWLVDWEAAFLNDRYLDLAVPANFLVKTEQDERQYLENYFNGGVTDYRRARFFLMRQLLHLFYFVTFILFGKKPEEVDLKKPTPPFFEYHNGIWNGDITFAGKESRMRYALVHMEQFKQNAKLPRFDEAVEIVGRRNY